MAKQEIVGANFRSFTTSGSMGVVTDTRYVRCVWPVLDDPVALFADGSSGIEVQGPPTPRNVVFPVDTVLLPMLVAQGTVNPNNPNALTWRESSILTNGSTYFIRERVMRDVNEDVEGLANVEVEPGLMRDVKYRKPGTVRRQVEVDTALTVAEARDMAAGRLSIETVRARRA